MPPDLLHGFRIGDWTVEPLKGVVTGPDRNPRHLQPKVMDVLVCLAAQADEPVTRNELLTEVWGRNAVSDEPLTHAIGELRRALQDDRRNPTYIETIPKRGYRLICSVEFIQSASEGRRIGLRLGERLRTGRRRYVAILTILILSAITATYLVYRPTPHDALPLAEQTVEDAIHAQPSPLSIAVLPFATTGELPDDEYFADGLTEEVLNALSQVPELQVIARTSSFFFKNKNIPVPDIAGSLNVANVVEGSVRREGQEIRITVQLVRASDGIHLWSESYERAIVDQLDVQVDIAEKIAGALGVLLDADARQLMLSAGINDVEAFIAYQKGLEAYATAHVGPDSAVPGLTVANSYFDKALEANPNLAALRILRADRAVHILQTFFVEDHKEKYAGEAKAASAALQNELELAWRKSMPGNQRDILNLERMLASDDWRGLQDVIAEAMLSGKCPRTNLTHEITAFGWAKQVAAKLQETLACNPMDTEAIMRLAPTLVWDGRADEALALLDHAEDNGVYHAVFFVRRFWALLATGRINDPALQGIGSRNDFLVGQIAWRLLLGDRLEAYRKVEQYWGQPGSYLPYSLTLAAMLGDRRRANEFAARIDSIPGSASFLAGAVNGCMCGAPFDLEATPNFAARINEANFPWPPPTIIEYPTKDW